MTFRTTRCLSGLLVLTMTVATASAQTGAAPAPAAKTTATDNTNKTAPQTLPPVTPELIKRRSEQMHQKFKSADTDHDGFLTRAEAQKGMPTVAKYFDQIDTQHAGKVSEEDVAKFLGSRKVAPAGPAAPIKPAH
ncbi:MAG TPA: EF-hand domain-containing protein [Rudaea sp.]